MTVVPSGGVLGVAWAALVAAGAWRRRPPRRGRAVAGPGRAGARRLCDRGAGTRALRDGGVDRHAVDGAASGWRAASRTRVPGHVARERRRREQTFAGAVPEVVDLLVLAIGAGLTVPLAVAAVARRSRGPLAPELVRVTDEVALGRRLADALDDVPTRTSEAVRPVVAALTASERYGAPVLDALERLAIEVRRERRRRAEEAARRVPVKLLFPLVGCTLPAFGLLTVAPLIAGALRALRH